MNFKEYADLMIEYSEQQKQAVETIKSRFKEMDIMAEQNKILTRINNELQFNLSCIFSIIDKEELTDTEKIKWIKTRFKKEFIGEVVKAREKITEYFQNQEA